MDNIVLIQKTLHWACTSRQLTISLKLDFLKAYDKISWRFIFHAMRKMGICERYIKWVQLFFGNATAAVNLNGSPGSSLKNERGPTRMSVGPIPFPYCWRGTSQHG